MPFLSGKQELVFNDLHALLLALLASPQLGGFAFQSIVRMRTHSSVPGLPRKIACKKNDTRCVIFVGALILFDFHIGLIEARGIFQF